jgi:hypothetical protein
MARATATYAWADDCSVTVSVETEAGFPDSVAEVTVRCRELLRQAATDLATDIAEIDGE